MRKLLMNHPYLYLSHVQGKVGISIAIRHFMFTKLSDLMPLAAAKNSLSGTELKASMMVNRAGVIIKTLFPHPKIHSLIKVRSFKDGVLKCSVSSSSMAQAFQGQSHQLKRLLNESMESEVVKDIRCFQEVEAPEEDYEGY